MTATTAERVLLDFDSFIKASNTREERSVYQSAKLQAEVLDCRLAAIEQAILKVAEGQLPSKG